MDRLKNQHLNLVVLGQFKRGKTTVINALLGEKVLPSAVIPLTSIVTKPIYSKDKGAEVIFKSVTKAEALKSINEPEAQARLRVLDLYREQIEGLSRRVL
ncbi:MAG: dynamin family protein [Deltaproteobacteria bacterium]|nr:dynamin family protein [Deltaproteobacteria bacterium]